MNKNETFLGFVNHLITVYNIHEGKTLYIIINGSPAYLTVIHLCFIHFILFISANIALRKPTYMSSAYSGLSDSSKAVDGLKTNLAYGGGQCAVSAYGHKTAEWWVDLGDLYVSIYNITIYTRTENLAWSKYLKNIFDGCMPVVNAYFNIIYIYLTSFIYVYLYVPVFITYLC